MCLFLFQDALTLQLNFRRLNRTHDYASYMLQDGVWGDEVCYAAAARVYEFVVSLQMA